MRQRPDHGARIAVVAALVGLGVAYWLGAQRASELRFAADGVRRHEARLDAHDKLLAAHETRLEGHDRAISAVEAAVVETRTEEAALKEEVESLKLEVEHLKADAAKRDDAFAKMLERIERLEAMKSARIQ